MRIVLLGNFGRIPFAGMVWEALHYLEGFRRLGHDIYYVEDSAHWPYFPDETTTTEQACLNTAEYIGRMMTWCGMPDKWAYRTVAQENRVYGLSETQFADLFRTADLVINLAGSTSLREEHLRVPIRAYLQTDPGSGEIQAAQGDPGTLKMLNDHTHHFIFAENLGAPDCGLPPQPVKYHATRNPIILEWFAPEKRVSSNGNGNGSGHHHPLRFTTVGNWNQAVDGFEIEWNGERYTWSKHFEFLKFIDLPLRIKQPVELALASITDEDISKLRSYGWHVVEACPLTKDILPYREYLWGSDGEFTVAKDQNIRLRSGWFSDRSASYLAAGKPVITQDTAFGNILQTGEGLFAFSSMEGVVSAFDAIRSDYKKHSQAAHAIAQEYFRAETVLTKFLNDLN